MPDKNLTICLAVALALRLLFVFAGFPCLEPRMHLREDHDGYGLIAQSIREGHYDDVTRAPVYPAFVAAAGSPLAVKSLQALLDTATCALIFLLAGRNVWAAWLWAVYPFAIWRVAFISKETVVTFLLVSYMGVQLRALDQNKPASWLRAGVMLGLLNLSRSTFLLWPLVVAGFAVGKFKQARNVLLLAVAMGLVILPWTIRNFVVTGGDVLPVATEYGGMSTFVGNYQPTLGLWEGPGKIQWMAAVDEIKLQNAGASVVQLDRAFYRAAWRQVAANPLKAAELALRKCGRFWFVSAARRELVASVVIQSLYLALGVLGLWRSRPWRAEHGLMLAMILYVMALHAISYADSRYSPNVMPFVCMFAAAAFQRHERRTAASLSAAAASE